MVTVYEAAGGAEGLLRLARAWHARVLADEVVSHAFLGGTKPDHEQRLAAYWSEALGGPHAYSTSYGDESAVVRLHSGNGEHAEMDERAIACFDAALVDAGLADPGLAGDGLADPGLTGDGRLRSVLHDYFAWTTRTTIARYRESAEEVPGGLQIPTWSWEGLVGGP